MGAHKSAKKHAKKIARRDRVAEKQKRVAAKRQRAEELARQNEFPPFVFEPNGAPDELVEAVRQAVKAIDFRDETSFYKWETDIYREVKRSGAATAMALLLRSTRNDKTDHVAESHFIYNIGRQVFRLLGDDFLLRFVPFHDVLIQPRDHHILVYFRSLKQARGPGGTVYYSRHEPKLEVNGQSLVVAFSGHAIHRTRERLTHRWPTYTALGDVFAFFDQCLEFELCVLYPDLLGFTFFDHCFPGFSNYEFARQVMGERFIPGAPYCFRVGYCPAVVEGGFIKAKTLLFPGYAGTPEYGKIMSAALPRERKQAMVEVAKSLDAKHTLEPDGLELLKWFHDQGVPQARQGEVRYAEAVHAGP
jgi:hypothetical protein